MKFLDKANTSRSLSGLTTAITRGRYTIELYFGNIKEDHSILYLHYLDPNNRDCDIAEIDRYLRSRNFKSVNRFEDLGIKLSGKQEW